MEMFTSTETIMLCGQEYVPEPSSYISDLSISNLSTYIHPSLLLYVDCSSRL